MISYAQNFEDVILWRAFKNIKNGFYIDVGANDPEVDSVTKWFYDQGWNGINIEPMTLYYQRLCEQRERDNNLSVALDSHKGTAVLYEIADTGLSTLDLETAQNAARSGRSFQQKTIESWTLSDVCEKYLLSEQTIHFLKIDVEGYEDHVLRGMDLRRWRPLLLVIEATKPLSQDLYVPWESRILEDDYKFLYFDGVNRFYTACEQYEELEPFFRCPPNVFDDYKKINVLQMEQLLVEKEHALEKLEQCYRSILSSKSWRYTQAFRTIRHKINTFLS